MQKYLFLFVIASILSCSNEQDIVLKQGDIVIGKDSLKCIIKRVCKITNRFSCIKIQLPDSINVNISKGKLILKNGTEFAVHAEMICNNGEIYPYEISGSLAGGVCLDPKDTIHSIGTGEYSEGTIFKEVHITSEIPFHTNLIEWISGDEM